MVEIELDEEANAGYLRVADGKVSSTKELAGDVLLDLDADGNVLGVEFLGFTLTQK